MIKTTRLAVMLCALTLGVSALGGCDVKKRAEDIGFKQGDSLLEKGTIKYDGLVDKDEACIQAWGDIDATLQRRNDLIPNLVQVAKGYAKHEQDTLDKVIQARASATQVKLEYKQGVDDFSDPAKMQQFQAAQSGMSQALGKLMVVKDLDTATSSSPPLSPMPVSHTNYDGGPNDYSGILWLFGLFGIVASIALFGAWYGSRPEKTVRKLRAVRDDPYVPPPLPRQTYTSPTGTTTHIPTYTPPKHTSPSVVSGPAAVVATATVVSSVQARRDAQRKADEARKARDQARRKADEERRARRDTYTESTYVAPSYTSTYVSRDDDDDTSSSSGGSSPDSDSGSGFGGGDSGGGGGTDSC